MPREIVDCDVDMPEPGRYSEGGGAVRWHELKILGSIMNQSESIRQRVRRRRIDDELCREFFFRPRGRSRLGRAISSGLWIKPLRHFKLDDTAREGLVVGVFQLDLDFVGPWR